MKKAVALSIVLIFFFFLRSGAQDTLSVSVAEAKAIRAAQKDMPAATAQEGQAFLEANKKKAGVITLPSGLQYKILKQGTGVKPVLSDTVKVYYTGMLVNGKIFTSSYEDGKPENIPLNKVIKGWQEGLQLMPVGSRYIFYIPADLAFGEKTYNGMFLPNSVLIFEVTLIGLNE